MTTSNTRPTLVLASTSPFRKEILQKLGLPFDTAAPDIDESRRPDEDYSDFVRRLSEEKAAAVQSQFPQHLIIGGDQIAVCNDVVLGKPGNYDKAHAQLTQFSGQCVTFYTGLSLLDSKTGDYQTCVELFRVHFRTLNTSQIHNYLTKEEPYNCAGSFKSEGLGITLFRKLEGDDPNTLIGLPLIKLVSFLDNKGLPPI
ncbi:MAG: septum formation inhibitor Maf [Methylococcales bacterium]|nr:septum formation inhibitor Maf [Methylococcales bacterium]MBT7443639.1 septum formation inhibitor Maf [Methylococcales bacterium]